MMYCVTQRITFALFTTIYKLLNLMIIFTPFVLSNLFSSQNLVSSIIVLLAGMSAMITALTTGTLAPSLVGLAITYALSVSLQFTTLLTA